MWPVLGPSSVRDSVGLYVDSRTSMLRKIKNVDARNDASRLAKGANPWTMSLTKALAQLAQPAA